MTTRPQASLLIGLTGSIGSGKSTVAALIGEEYPVLDTDRIARDIMESDEAVRASLIERFGMQTYLSDGTLDRQFLASLVFEDTAKLRALNAIVHPPTMERVMIQAAKLHAEGKRLVFVESAIIFEVGIEETFDYTVAVVAETELTITRIMERDKSDRDAVLSRLRHQLPPEEKSGLADFTIRNNGTLEDLKSATASIVLILSRLGKRQPS
ncbi:MAG: dephospho-CoA kinase [Bacteroidetes bacterium]|nr:dephospho-CoA kinase [Bacteroidota bacterium]